MCGITGFWSPDGAALEDQAVLGRMALALRHRGPDHQGFWSDPEAGIGLGHRRLAILDLSPEGNQPMASANGRYVIVFNGEIYNFLDLRAELAGAGEAFRGHSDTEVMLAAIQRWGLGRAVERFTGMFAFALWDRVERTLQLVRDRIGEKPLYYGWMGRSFLFGSELKALRCHPAWRGEVDREALALFLRYGEVPTPHSIYRGVFKAPPGSIVTLRSPTVGRDPVVEPYWSALDMALAGAAEPWEGGDAEIVDRFEALLLRTIKREMIADVPLGAFLSGGIDSSVVVALMQEVSSRPVQSFTIGFNEAAYNEAHYARAVASHLGTDHTEYYVSPAEAMAVIPRLPELYDEPFADSSQIPTFLVAQLARKSVTVSLSGDGGDELFAGYERYPRGRRAWRRMQQLPHAVRGGLARSLSLIAPHQWDRVLRGFSALPGVSGNSVSGETVHKLAAVLQARTVDRMYDEVLTHWRDPETVVLGCRTEARAEAAPDRLADPVLQMMYLDLVRYLPDDILVKVDRATMGVSLESRAPFLDHEIVEAAWRIPLSLKLRGTESKWPLRQILARRVPRELIDRPKMGFGVPIESWLRGPLREWAEELLNQPRLEREGFFDSAKVSRTWAAHLSGRRDRRYLLWDVLMFQAWLAQEGADPVTDDVEAPAALGAAVRPPA